MPRSNSIISVQQQEDKINLCVGNLSAEVTEGDFQQAFETFGEVTSAKIIKDNYSGKSRGFGFVEMPSGAEAQSAINNRNEKELKGFTYTQAIATACSLLNRRIRHGKQNKFYRSSPTV